MKGQIVAVAGLVSLLGAQTAPADVLGGRVGANVWGQQYEGDVRDGPDAIDLESDLGLDDETGHSFYFQFEHFIPLIPNIMLQRTEIDADANSNVQGFEFDRQTFDGDTRTTLDLTHSDITLYYEILDNWINLDLGITGRIFEEGVEITDLSSGEKGSLDLDEVVPMGYVNARFDLPFTGWSLGGELYGTEYDDQTLYDVKFNVGWEILLGIGIEAGYRYFDLDYEDGREKADLTIDGVYGGVFWDF